MIVRAGIDELSHNPDTLVLPIPANAPLQDRAGAQLPPDLTGAQLRVTVLENRRPGDDPEVLDLGEMAQEVVVDPKGEDPGFVLGIEVHQGKDGDALPVQLHHGRLGEGPSEGPDPGAHQEGGAGNHQNRHDHEPGGVGSGLAPSLQPGLCACDSLRGEIVDPGQNQRDGEALNRGNGSNTAFYPSFPPTRACIRPEATRSSVI